MRNLNKIALAALLVSSWAFAEPISLDFKGATVVEVVQVLVRDILKRDYVISPEVIAADKRITVSVRKADSESLMPLIEGILKTVNVQVEQREGVLYVERLAPVMPAAPIPQQVQSPGPGAFGGVQPMTFGAGGLGYNQQPVVKIPEEIESYAPRGRTVEFLAAVVKATGALVVEYKGKGDRLVYSGTKEAMIKARAIIKEVDSPPATVHVRAVLVEFTEGKTDSRSISIALSALAGKIGAIYQAGSVLANALTYKGSTLTAALSAIEGDSRFKYVAEPSLRVTDGEMAKLVVGSEVPTRGAVTQDKNGNSMQSIDYRTAGVVINLEPRVLDGMVSLKIGQQISTFALTTTSNIDSPTILKRESQTTVAVRPGELVMLAGMDEDRNSSSGSGLSWLPSFMQSHNGESSRSQLVLLLEVIPEV